MLYIIERDIIKENKIKIYLSIYTYIYIHICIYTYMYIYIHNYATYQSYIT